MVLCLLVRGNVENMTDTDELIPANFICTLTRDAFDDPVVASDGHTYSRKAIEHWFSLQQTSPMTGARLDSTQLFPNHTLRKSIEEWRGKQPLPIDPQRIHVTEEVLGEGSFGRVVAGTLKIGGGRVVRVAIKSLPAMTVAEEREAFQRELKPHIHALRHCDGICKLYGTCERDNRLSLVMKLYEGGSLARKITDGSLDADKIRRYSHALCQALRQLHGCGLVVRDIKPPNILFDSFDQPVLADFGIAEVVSTATRHHTSIKGTFSYMAPETFLDPKQAGYPGVGPPADVWAMACVVVEMHTGKDPWDGMNMQQIMRAVSVDYRAPAVPAGAPAHTLLQRCFLRTPLDRPSAGDLADAFAPPPTCSLAKDARGDLKELFEGLVRKFAKEHIGSSDSSGSEKEEVDFGTDKDKEDPSLPPWEKVFNRYNKFWRRLACIAALKTHNSDALVEAELEYFGPVIEDLHAANWVIKRPIQRILLEGVRVLGPAAIDRYDLNRTLIEP